MSLAADGQTVTIGQPRNETMWLGLGERQEPQNCVGTMGLGERRQISSG